MALSEGGSWRDYFALLAVGSVVSFGLGAGAGLVLARVVPRCVLEMQVAGFDQLADKVFPTQETEYPKQEVCQ